MPALRFPRDALTKDTPIRVVFLAALLLAYPVLNAVFIPPGAYESREIEQTGRPIYDSAVGGGDWIVYNQNPDGSYRYTYDYETNEYGLQNNMLRHAGTTFALSWLYNATGDYRYMRAARRGCEFLRNRMVDLPGGRSAVSYFGTIKLGGAALGVLAFSGVRLLDNDTSRDSDMKRLGRFIISMQNESGHFRSYYRATYFYELDREVSVYAGESLYALARLYRIFGDETYLRAFEKAVDEYRPYMQKTHDTAFYAWATSGCCEMYEATKMHTGTGNRTFADFAFEMTDHMAYIQVKDEESEDCGSFGGVVSINTGTYTEGIGDAYRIAVKLNDSKRVNSYGAALLRGCRSVMKLQMLPGDLEDAQCPDRALGGFRSRLWDPVLRIDYAQHAVSGMSRVLVEPTLSAQDVDQ